MYKLGPEWLRRELPQPIASAWHHAVEYPGGDAMAGAAAVEIALRFVTALQVANLVAEGRSLPKALSAAAFKRPTLGCWVALVKEAREALEGRSYLAELGTWPEDTERRLLDRFVELRNELGHDLLPPLTRQRVEHEISELILPILTSLDWLREPRLLFFTEARREAHDLMVGRVQVLRSFEAYPPSEFRAWRGTPKVHHVYLASSNPSDDRLLDVEPFIRRTRLKSAKVDAVCLWSGFDGGRVLLSDDHQQVDQWFPVSEGPRFAHFDPTQVEPQPSDPTRPEVFVGSSLRDAGRPTKGRRLFVALGTLVFAGACVAAIAAASSDSATDEAAPQASAVTVPRASAGNATAGKGQGPGEPSGHPATAGGPFAEHAFLPEFVDRFCRGTVSESDLTTLDRLAHERAISVRALIAVFNIYGAFYGYTFKSEVWLNDLYYGAGATQLPGSCRARIRTYRSEGEVPGTLESVRDRVKRIWRDVK